MSVEPRQATRRIDGHVEGQYQAEGDLHVGGSVRTGCALKVQGNLIVEGAVESGALVQAQGDVRVGGGISGEPTRLSALGGVQCHFIRNSRVVARGDIAVGYYIANAWVRAGGRLVVGVANGTRGSIVGGEVQASQGIEAPIIGSAVARRTSIGLVPGLELEVRLKRLRERLDFCNGDIQRIFRTLEVRDLNPDTIDQLLHRSGPSKKKLVGELLEKLKRLAASREELLAERRRLEAELANSYQNARIVVSDTLHAGVQVRIGDALLDAEQDLAAPVLYLGASGVEWEARQT